MAPEPSSAGSVRSAADINADIRALWQRARGTLTPDDRRRYSELLAEYEQSRLARSPAA
jgi:hypothetical protein